MTNKRILELLSIGENEFVTVEEASELMGIKVASVRNYLHLGRLTTYKFKTLTLIRKSEAETNR